MMQIRLSYLAIVISCVGYVGQADAVASFIEKLLAMASNKAVVKGVQTVAPKVAKKVAKKAAGFAFKQALTNAGQVVTKAGQTVVEAGKNVADVGIGFAKGAGGQLLSAYELTKPINWLSGAKDVLGQLSKLNQVRIQENLLTDVTSTVKNLLEATKAMTPAQMAGAVGGGLVMGAGAVKGANEVLKTADEIQKVVGKLYANATASEKTQLQELKDNSDALKAQAVVCSQEAQRLQAAAIAQATPSEVQKMRDNANTVLAQLSQREQVLRGS